MSFKSKYIYIFVLFVLVVLIRENFDFTLGDRGAYLSMEGWDSEDALRNRLTAQIFSNLKYLGEFLFCIIYYKNVFKLSLILFLNTKIKYSLNKRFTYYSIILSLFAPVTILFTSFAGKDIIAIYLASELCIDAVQLKYQKETHKLNILKIFKFIIYSILLFIFRKMTMIFLLILVGLTIVQINKKIKSLSVIIFPIFLLPLIFYSDVIYQSIAQEFVYQAKATYSDYSTFTTTNEFLTFGGFFINSYQMFTNVALIHFSESFLKASLIFLNSFLSYIVTIFVSLVYFVKNLKIGNSFFFKAIFLLLFFVINGFLSQNNPGGAIRYMSSIIPVYTTFIFAILPE